MAKLRIVYVPTADLRGPDLTRIGTVEDVPDELARIMVADGQAVYADNDGDEQASDVVNDAAQPGPAVTETIVGPDTGEQLPRNGRKAKTEAVDTPPESTADTDASP